MTIKFLLFRGSWANEGNFYALEDEKTILLLAIGKDQLPNVSEQELNYDYLKEKSNKIRAILINNTKLQNVGILVEICQSFGKEVPIFTTVANKLILDYLFPQFKKKINIITIHHSNYSFYFIENLLLSNCWENELLFVPNFLSKLITFLSKRREKVCLITSFSNFQ